jgi:hypothetical protein
MKENLKLSIIKMSDSFGIFNRKPKFLVLENGTVIVGVVFAHSNLWVTYCLESEEGLNPESKPVLVGTGEYSRNGDVISWESTSFDFDTPDEHKVTIQGFLREHLGELPH